jgi:serine/threonine protein kinase
MLAALEALHVAGYVHNDIKMDNILMKDEHLTLIDFGCASSYLSGGNHIHKSFNPKFVGNYLFSSIQQMNCQTSSRKDDLVSLCYLMLYLIRGRNLFGENKGFSDEALFEKLYRAKSSMTIDQLCSKSAICIKQFIQTILTMDFETRPNYKLLRRLLKEGLRSKDETCIDGDISPDPTMAPSSP